MSNNLKSFISSIEFILYVSDQRKSKLFYQALLAIDPSLDVDGMTEFDLMNGTKLGLMPEQGISKILVPKLPNPSLGTGIPRCELYLKVENAENYIARGVKLGGILISEVKRRDWGDTVGYIADLDGHVIAFAEIGKLDNLSY